MYKRYLLLWFALITLPILACGGSTGAIGSDIQVSPENVRIEGLPQFVCPTSTPMQTDTPYPTEVQPTVYVPASGYATRTSVPGCIWNGYTCATHTPQPGGNYINPGYTRPGPTSTPRATYTPYPTPTPYTSTYQYFIDEDVYTDHAAGNLALRLRVGNIRVLPSTQVADHQIVIVEVQIANHGSTFYLFLASVQIFIAEISNQSGQWLSSRNAANEAGISLHSAALDVAQIQPGESLTFDLTFYTPIGEVGSIGWILDPYANGFDGKLAGGNIGYWQNNQREGCVGHIDGLFTPQPHLTPHPTATHTPSLDFCLTLQCVTRMP